MHGTRGLRREPARRVLRVLAVPAVLAAVLAGVSGCASVKAYEREMLADPIMERQDFFAKQSLEQKFFSTREGSIGGAAGIGGGCGCAK
jgi:hypothetical protein